MSHSQSSYNAYEVNFLSAKGLFFQSCSETKLIPVLHSCGFGIRKLRLEALLPNSCVCFPNLHNLSVSGFLLSKIGMVIPVSEVVECIGGSSKIGQPPY